MNFLVIITIVFSCLGILLGIKHMQLKKGFYDGRYNYVKAGVIAPFFILVFTLMWYLSGNMTPKFLSGLFIFSVVLFIAQIVNISRFKNLVKKGAVNNEENLDFYKEHKDDDKYTKMFKEFNFAIRNKTVESLKNFGEKYDLNDEQMNYLLQSFCASQSSKGYLYKFYAYINYEIQSIVIGQGFYIRVIQFMEDDMVLLNEESLMKRIQRLDNMDELDKENVYFIALRYINLKKTTTDVDEINYKNYKESKKRTYDIYLRFLNEYFRGIKQAKLKAKEEMLNSMKNVANNEE